MGRAGCFCKAAVAQDSNICLQFLLALGWLGDLGTPAHLGSKTLIVKSVLFQLVCAGRLLLFPKGKAMQEVLQEGFSS